MDRRRFLATGGAVVAALGAPSLLGAWTSAPAPVAAAQAPGAGQPFTRAMPVAPVARPVSSNATTDFYRIPVRATTAEIVTGTRTTVLSYGSGFVGPTIRTRTGRTVKITFDNQLTEPTNVHLHGGHTAAVHDGHPMDAIAPGASRLYEYRNNQQGTTLWYHDHIHHLETEHNFRGLQGAYVIEDDAERSLRLPSGDQDVPIMLRDVELDADGQLVFGSPFTRTIPVANGVAQPYFPVTGRKYRLRFVNCATERVFTLTLPGATFVQIGSDGGLLPKPVPLTTLTIGSAERADVVVDFSKVAPGTSLTLTDATMGAVMRFDVVRRAVDLSRMPVALRALPVRPAGTVFRDVNMAFDFSAPAPVGQINGKAFDMDRVDFTVKRGTTEIWTVTTTDPPVGISHTFHLHLVQFEVLERTGGLQPGDAGLKDTVRLKPGETIKVKATFTEYLGRYLYHCHFLEHSGLGMMAQLEIVA